MTRLLAGLREKIARLPDDELCALQRQALREMIRCDARRWEADLIQRAQLDGRRDLWPLMLRIDTLRVDIDATRRNGGSSLHLEVELLDALITLDAAVRDRDAGSRPEDHTPGAGEE